MSFFHRNQDRIRSVVLWILAMIAIRVGVHWLLGDSANNPAPPALLIGLGVLFVPLALLAIVGVAVLVGNQKRDLDSTPISAHVDTAWPDQPSMMRPSDRNEDREYLQKHGFEQVGSLRVGRSEQIATFGICLRSDKSTIAIKTPVHLVIVSAFEGKLLTTSNAIVETGPRYELSQLVPATSVDELLSVHGQAVEVVSVKAGPPTRFNDTDALKAVEAWERHAVLSRSYSSKTWKILLGLAFPFFEGETRPLITDNAPSRARVEQWLERPERWEASPA